MKKGIKKAKSIPSPKRKINPPKEINSELDLPTNDEEEFVYEPSITALLHYLDETKTAEQFYSQLSEIILVSYKLTQDEREYLASLVKEPYKPKRGAGIKERRYHEIFHDYILPLFIPDIPDSKKLRRTDAIKEIAERYKITSDAAGKSYDIARKHQGDAPPPKKTRAKSGNK